MEEACHIYTRSYIGAALEKLATFLLRTLPPCPFFHRCKGHQCRHLSRKLTSLLFGLDHDDNFVNTLLGREAVEAIPLRDNPIMKLISHMPLYHLLGRSKKILPPYSACLLVGLWVLAQWCYSSLGRVKLVQALRKSLLWCYDLNFSGNFNAKIKWY